jgi:hypothetical protein
LIVPTDGKTLVAVQRIDISLDSPEGRELAIADNRAGELNLSWDYSELLDLHDKDEINLNDWWNGEEIDAMAGAADNDAIDPRGTGEESNSKEVDPDDFDLEHQCPKCGFQFDS